jgi:ATP dependent DNA ligase domain
MQDWADLLTALEHAAASAPDRGSARRALDDDATRALVAHLARVPRRDAAWALWLLAGGRVPARLSMARLREAVARETAHPPWLIDASHAAVGDWAETLALLLPETPRATLPPSQAVPHEAPTVTGPMSNADGIAGMGSAGLADWLEASLPSTAALALCSAAQCAAALRPAWSALNPAGRVVLHRLLTGTLRPRVPPWLLQRALAVHTGLDEALLAQRLARDAARPGRKGPDVASFLALLPLDQGARDSRDSCDAGHSHERVGPHLLGIVSSEPAVAAAPGDALSARGIDTTAGVGLAAVPRRTARKSPAHTAALPLEGGMAEGEAAANALAPPATSAGAPDAGGHPLPFTPLCRVSEPGAAPPVPPVPPAQQASLDGMGGSADATPSPATDSAGALTPWRADAPRGLASPEPGRAWAQWAYPGLRAQCVRHAGQVWLWRADMTLLNRQFPEAVAQAADLPEDCVLEVLLLAWPAATPGMPAPRSRVLARLQRAAPTAAQRAEAPVRWLAVDLLRLSGQDLRALPVATRQNRLAALCRSAPAGADWPCAPRLVVPDAAALAHHLDLARRQGLTGIVLRTEADGSAGPHPAPDAGAGTTLWLIAPPPLRLHTVLVHAQAGQGSGAASASVFSLAVWSRPPAGADEAAAALAALARRAPPDAAALHLVTVAQVRDGFSAEALRLLARRVRETTLDKFGPVRTLRPSLVIEIAFDGVEASTRHRCGLLLHGARALRLCPQAALHTAADLADLRRWLPGHSAP